MIHEGKLNGVLNRSSCQPAFRLPPLPSVRLLVSPYSSSNLEAYRNRLPEDRSIFHHAPCPSACFIVASCSRIPWLSPLHSDRSRWTSAFIGAISYLLWGRQPRIVENRNSLLAKEESRVKNFDDNFPLLTICFLFSFSISRASNEDEFDA